MFLMEEFRHLKIQLQDIISATENFSPNQLIGQGGFGKVYKGELSFSEGRSIVALKRLDRKFGQGNTEFWKEIMMLSKCKHENLVSLLHFCFEGDERILVYEYASRGSLDRYLSDANLTWIQRLKICVGVAHGLNYLHDPMETKQRILHRDIKSSNILLDEEWNAKVSDFGLSKVGPANQPQTFLVSNVVGTFGYCDPSYFETGLLSKESDVYSFGVVLFEVMCGRLCCEYRNGEMIRVLVPMWRKCFEEDRLDDIIFHDLKEQIQHDSLMTFSTIANRCLQRDHIKRPTMAEIVQQLEVAIEQQLGNNTIIGVKRRPTISETSTRGSSTPPLKFNATVTEESSSRHGRGQQPRLWLKERSKGWWEHYNSDECPDEDFKKAFRMTKSTFNMICSELVPVITNFTMLQLKIPVRQRVAVCLYHLATGDPLRTVSTQFGLGISTCHKVVLDVSALIKNVLMPKFLHWPDDERLEEIKTEFRSISGIPNVSGSIYTTHISIIAPKVSTATYFNKRHTERSQKASYSTTIQGVVDSLGRFTNICVGYPGSMSDDKILEISTLWNQFNMGNLKNIWVVGNSGYPLLDWLLVPYTHQNLSWSEQIFNEKIEKIQKTTKDAFMRLKGRWTFLQKRTEVKLQDLPLVLEACCVLHNICEIKGEAMDADLRFDLFDDEIPVAENGGDTSVIAMQARDSITESIANCVAPLINKNVFS